MTSTLERETEQVRGLFARVEEVESIADSLRPDKPEEAQRLYLVARCALDAAEPVRATIAAELLHISARTVSTWATEGLLVCRQESPRRLDPVRLHEVWHLVRDLRQAGRNRDLMNAVWYRLQDQALLDREDLAESLDQLRAGKTLPALTREEEEQAADQQ